MLLGCLDNG